MWADIDTSSRTNLPQHRCSGFFISVEGDSLYAREGDVRHGRHVCLVEWSSLFRSDVVVERRGTARVSEVFRQRRKRREPVCTRQLLVLLCGPLHLSRGRIQLLVFSCFQIRVAEYNTLFSSISIFLELTPAGRCMAGIATVLLAPV